MKKTAEILGLPVISITEGKELGHVKELVVNAAAGTVAAIVVDCYLSPNLAVRISPTLTVLS